MENTTTELRLSVRKYKAEPDLQIKMVPERAAFLLVDCDESSADKHVVENEIYSALSIARESGMKIVYLFNAIYGVGGPNDVTTKIHGLDFLENSWKPLIPKFNSFIQPLDNEAVIPKSHKDGFNGNGGYAFDSLEGVKDINLIEIAVSWKLDGTFQEEISEITLAIANHFSWIIEDGREN
jgi:hypothetical protein